MKMEWTWNDILKTSIFHAPDGELRLYCVDHGDLFLPNGPPNSLRSEAARLLAPLPHALLLQTENSEFHVL